ncbi:MAG: hypothetical protein ACI8RD_005412 [Bacillariaceae sp.]|jgi:hypothetical protein
MRKEIISIIYHLSSEEGNTSLRLLTFNVVQFSEYQFFQKPGPRGKRECFA